MSGRWLVGVLLLVACGGSSGNGSSTGLPSWATLSSLNQAQAARLCDWMNYNQGGYGRSVTCLDGSQQTTDADKASCVQVVPQVGIDCPTLTVGDVESCVNVIGPMLCEVTTSAACANLAACLGPPSCHPSIYLPWVIESSNGTPVSCGQAGVFYVEALVNTQAYEVDCQAGQTLGTMSIPVAGPGSYTIVVSLLDIDRVDVVAPTPPLTVSIPQTCADVTTIEAVFVLP
jgi:hypothetical protein